MKIRQIGKKMIIVCLVMVLTVSSTTGCRNSKKVVFTTGLAADEIFKIGKASCTKEELMVHLITFYNRYVETYGEEMWKYDFGGISLEDHVKEVILSKMTQIKIMNLMAEERQISLTAQEEQKAAEAASRYYDLLEDSLKKKENITQKTAETVFYEYALANKVYLTITESADMEISDDEARTVTVQEIYLKNWKLKNNDKVPMTEEEKENVLHTAEEIVERLRQGEDFETIAALESDEKQLIKSYARGDAEEAFEEVLFALDEGEVSGVLQTEEGYHIVKCVSTMDYEATQANKLVLAEQRKKAAFSEAYEEIAVNTHSQFRDKQWEKITLDDELYITEADFFEIYEEYME